MDIEEIKQRIRQEILNAQFPELADIDPQVKSGPAESQLRALRRSRAFLTEDDLRAIPLEHQFTYRRLEDELYPFDKTVVVVTNDEGETDFIIESK
jgi:hypothetical protein